MEKKGVLGGRIGRMKLYLVRHGETDWNKVKKIQGQVDIPDVVCPVTFVKEIGRAHV